MKYAKPEESRLCPSMPGLSQQSGTDIDLEAVSNEGRQVHKGIEL
jgi:hypothetical protein